MSICPTDKRGLKGQFRDLFGGAGAVPARAAASQLKPKIGRHLAIRTCVQDRAVEELFRVLSLGKACKRSKRPMQKSRDAAAMINIAAKKPP